MINLKAPQLFGLFANVFFLGQAFIIMLVYVWSRRHPLIRMNFFGLLNFQAPFLPWVLMGFSLLLGNSIVVDLLGMRRKPTTSDVTRPYSVYPWILEKTRTNDVLVYLSVLSDFLCLWLSASGT